MKKYFSAIFMILILCASTEAACGASPDNATTATDNETVFSSHAPERFGRGVINIISSPLEFPAQMYARAKYYENTVDNVFAPAGGFIEGIPMGLLVYFPWRLGAGIYDFFTFPFRRCDACIIHPPYMTFSSGFLEK